MIRKTVRSSALCLMFATLAAIALPAQEAKTRPTDVYKVDYIFSEFQDNKRVNARSYTTLTRTGEKTSIRLGSRLPYPIGVAKDQYQYIDVGVNIDCRIEQSTDSGVGLFTNVDVSRLAPEQTGESRTGVPVVRQTKIQVDNIVPLGKQILLSSADEVDGTGRFQVEVTVTKAK